MLSPLWGFVIALGFLRIVACRNEIEYERWCLLAGGSNLKIDVPRCTDQCRDLGGRRRYRSGVAALAEVSRQAPPQRGSGVLGWEGPTGCRPREQFRDGNAAGVEVGDVVGEGNCEGVVVDSRVDVGQHGGPPPADVRLESLLEVLLPGPGCVAELDWAGGASVGWVDPDGRPPDFNVADECRGELLSR